MQARHCCSGSLSPMAVCGFSALSRPDLFSKKKQEKKSRVCCALSPFFWRNPIPQKDSQRAGRGVGICVFELFLPIPQRIKTNTGSLPGFHNLPHRRKSTGVTHYKEQPCRYLGFVRFFGAASRNIVFANPAAAGFSGSAGVLARRRFPCG